MKKIETLDDMVKALGGGIGLAPLLGISPQSISNWKRKKVIPSRQRLSLILLLKERGLAFAPELFGLESRDLKILEKKPSRRSRGRQRSVRQQNVKPDPVQPVLPHVPEEIPAE